MLSALAAADGRTKDRTVRAAVDALAALNPTVPPARATALLGKWKQINSPEYPNMLGLDDQGNPQYTLGRLTFGIFEPKDLVCSTCVKKCNAVPKKNQLLRPSQDIDLAAAQALHQHNCLSVGSSSRFKAPFRLPQNSLGRLLHPFIPNRQQPSTRKFYGAGIT